MLPEISGRSIDHQNNVDVNIKFGFGSDGLILELITYFYLTDFNVSYEVHHWLRTRLVSVHEEISQFLLVSLNHSIQP